MLTASFQRCVLVLGWVWIATGPSHAFDDLSATSVELNTSVSLMFDDQSSVDHLCGGEMGQDHQMVIDVRVRPGESLDHFARWVGTTVEQIAAINEMEVTAPLYPGMSLMLPLDDHLRPSLEAARNADVELRLSRFIDRKGGLAGIAAHQVRTGETGWDIARKEAGVPVWVLSAFNADKDLGRLSVGDTLYLPIMGEKLGQEFDAAASEATIIDDETPEWE